MNPNVESAWEVEVWVNGEFDIGFTCDTYNEALARYTKEVERPYSGDWVGSWEVKLYESKKELVLKTSEGRVEDDG